MDPATIVGLVSGAAQLAMFCGSMVKDLNTIASKYEGAKLTVLSMAQGLDTMQLAWSLIGRWAQDQAPDELTEHDNFTGRLQRSLETGTLVMEALKEDLLIFDHQKMGFTQRTKLMWSEGTLQSHQERIRDQASSMTLLLQAIQLRTQGDRYKLLRKSVEQFRKSDNSALSIVPSRMSTYTGQTNDSALSIGEEDLIYKPLTFENELFTARVYKRNWIRPAPQRFYKVEEQMRLDKVLLPSPREGIEDSTDGWEAENLTIGGQDNISIEAVPSTSSCVGGDPARERKARSSFFEACKKGDVDVVQRFVQWNRDIHALMSIRSSTDPGLSAMHLAAKSGHLTVVQCLLAHGANLEHKSSTSQARPLHLAVQERHSSMVRLLIENGADISARADKGVQAVHEAAAIGSAEILRTLFDHGAATESMDCDGARPLHYAARRLSKFNEIKLLFDRETSTGGCIIDRCLNILLEYGADVNARDVEGNTPLHCLCSSKALTIKEIDLANLTMTKRSQRRKGILQLLTEMGDLDVINQHGLTALYMSFMEPGREALTQTLIDSGARLLLKTTDITLGICLNRDARSDYFPKFFFSIYQQTESGRDEIQVGAWREYDGGAQSNRRLIEETHQFIRRLGVWEMQYS